MRIALLGGTPPLLGHGGLEVQIAETGAALRRLGVDVVEPWSSNDERLDAIHFFGADPATWNWLRNSQGTVSPVVLSPVLVLSPRRNALVERLQSRTTWLGQNTASMRSAVIRSASRVVALHRAEARYLQSAYGLTPTLIDVVGNGSDAVQSGSSAFGGSYLICVGTVGPRKSQLQLARRWGPEHPRLLFAGPMQDGWANRDEFLELVRAKANMDYLGPVARGELWDIQASAKATVSASEVEGESLAVLDSLRLGTPVAVRTSAASSALHERFGGGIVAHSDVDALVAHLGRQTEFPRVVERPPTWDDVARRLLSIYCSIRDAQ